MKSERFIGRLRKIAAATARFAAGQHDQRLPATAEDKIGQLNAQINQMAAQLDEHQAREKVLIEQNARLEEQARLSRDLQTRVKQWLFEHAAQKKILAEQNARLEERVRLSRDLHDSVKQQVFALAVQIELARSLLDQDHAPAREHLDEADELSYRVQQELSALIDALRPAELQAKGFMTVAQNRKLCYTCANKDRCSSQERTCAQAVITSP